MFVGFLSRKKRISSGKSFVSGSRISLLRPSGMPYPGKGWVIKRHNGFSQGNGSKADGWRKTRIDRKTANTVHSRVDGFATSTIDGAEHVRKIDEGRTKRQAREGSYFKSEATTRENPSGVIPREQTKGRLRDQSPEKDGDGLLMALTKKKTKKAEKPAAKKAAPITPPVDVTEHKPEPSVAKLTVEDIRSKIANVQFYKLGKKTTVALTTLTSGFEIVTSASCVNPSDYDEKIGRELAAQRGEDKVWELEGYLSQCSK